MILPHCWDILIYLLLLYHAVLKNQKRPITSQTKGRYYELRRSQNFRWVSQLKLKKVRPRRANNIAFGTDQPTPSVPQKKRDSPTYPNPNRQIPILKRPENRNPNQDSPNGKKPKQECSTDQKGRKNSQAKNQSKTKKKAPRDERSKLTSNSWTITSDSNAAEPAEGSPDDNIRNGTGGRRDLPRRREETGRWKRKSK